MIKFIALLLLTFYTGTCLGQVVFPAKTYHDFNSYLKHRYDDEKVFFDVIRSNGLNGDVKIKIYSVDDMSKSDKIKKLKYPLIEVSDMLFVNCKVIKNRLYSPVFYNNQQYLYFRAGTSGLKEHEFAMQTSGRKALENIRYSHSNGLDNSTIVLPLNTYGVATAVAISLLDQTTYLPTDSTNTYNTTGWYNYLLNLKTQEVHVINMFFMQDLLGDYPDIYQQYVNQEHPDHPTSVINILKARFEN